ncbi:CD3337/EF1877 family mobilome membrane protein [Bacillus cereus]|uniref:Type IV secretion system protein n=1 Tax=Bacillus cereus TaxID=1396 RepID=A0A9X7M0G3_BACCE|nr:hypothetical protein [Bacillus cereus]MDA2637900.1 hypothetical protein [Bacillus cereus]QDZ76609.1 hypothetical protein D0437_27595 [Bacillus cereus]
MKIRKWLLIVCLCFLLLPLSVGAEEKDEKVSPQYVESGGVKLESKVYDMSQYEPVTYVKASWNPLSSENLDKALNQIANFFFSLTKMVASLVDTSIDKLYSLSLINDAADDIADVSEGVYDNLAETLGIILILIAIVQIFYYYSAERSGGKAGRTTLALLAVLAVGTIWFSNASHYIKSMNALSNEMQGLIMTAGTTLADKKVAKGQEFQGSLAILRNSYFNLVVKKSYLIMNYGTPDETVITKDDKKDENRINKLLEYKTNEDGYKKRDEVIQYEATDLKNSYMSTSTVTAKIGVAFCSFLFALILGIPLLVLAFLSPGIQILALIFSLILGVSLLLSVLPYFSHSGWKNFEKIAGFFFMKGFIGLAILFIFVIVQLMERFIPSTTPDMYMLNVIATGASMILAYKFRDKIISTATGGRVTSIDGGVTKQLYEKSIQGPAEKVTAGAKRLAAAGGGLGVAAMKSVGKAGVKGGVRAIQATGNGAAKLLERAASRRTQGKQQNQSTEQQNQLTTSPQQKQNKEKQNGMRPKNVSPKDRTQTREKQRKTDQQSVEKADNKQQVQKDNVVPMPQRRKENIQRTPQKGQKQIEREQTKQKQSSPPQKGTHAKVAPVASVSERKTVTRTPQAQQHTARTKNKGESHPPTSVGKKQERPRTTPQPVSSVPRTHPKEQQQRLQKLQIHEQSHAKTERTRTTMRESNKE